ncbi:MAG: hypothetical protein ACT4OO_08925 [Nitrospiraceae bacterium]
MERMMESREATRGGTVAQGGNGHAVRFLPASEQFYTRSCARCAGLLVKEWCYDLDNTGEHNAEVLRCVQCGQRVDPVIMQNQIRTLVAHDQARRVRHKHSVRIELSGEAA